MNIVRDHFRYLTEPKHYGGIDILRACAILGVLAFHFQLFNMGWVGVDLFFVISGYLIGNAVLDELEKGRFHYGQFIGNRALRILPVYYASVLAFVFIRAIPEGAPITAQNLAPVLTLSHTTASYFLGWTSPEQFTPGGAWSLVIEAQFYILAPLVIWGAFKLYGRAGVFFTSVFAVASGPFLRAYMIRDFAPDDPNWHFASFVQFHSRYDELAAGVLLASLSSFLSLKWASKSLMAIVGLVLFASVGWYFAVNGYWMAPHTLTRETIWMPTVMAILFTILLAVMRDINFNVPIVIFIARISYPLYLFHYIFLLGNSLWSGTWFTWPVEAFGFHASLWFYALASVIAAYLVSLSIEFPFLRMYRPHLGKDRSSR